MVKWIVAGIVVLIVGAILLKMWGTFNGGTSGTGPPTTGADVGTGRPVGI